MPVSVRPCFATGGWGTPKIDLGGCVLYLPLWRPDMAGSTIYSHDTNHHTCTVNGTTWGATGRTFDGTNDYITLSNPSFTSNTQGTISIWVKPTAGASDIFGFTKLSTGNVDELRVQVSGAAGVEYFRFHINDNYASTHSLDTAAGTAVNDAWYRYVITSDGSANLIYINGESVAITETEGTADGAWFGNCSTDADQITIGALARSSNYIVDFTGIIGEIIVHSRPQTASEVKNSYLSTKWVTEL